MDYIPSGKPHGNTQKEKQMKAYRKTSKITIQSLRKIWDIEKPKSAYETVRKSIVKVAATAALPKNYRQAVYAKQTVSSQFKSVDGNRDELIRAIYSCKKPGDSFVREIQSAPEGISVLARDKQVSDIVRFCVLPNLAECCPLSVYLSFNLGNFYITVTSCKNKNLKNKEINNPVHIGPFQIHYRKVVSSYWFIGSSLKQINQKVSCLKIFGSDQEEKLVNACKE